VIEEENGNYEKAISSLIPLSTESRKDRLEDYSRYHLAVCYYNLGKYESAQKYFERVAYTYTRIEEAPLSLYYDGLCLLKLKEYKKAGERFALLVKEFPLHPLSKEAEYLVAESIYENAKKERWGANPTATLNYILKYLDEVIEKYPGTELADKSYYLRAEAIRKLTDTFNEMKNYEAARRTYALLVGYEEMHLKPPEEKKKKEEEKIEIPAKVSRNPITAEYRKLAWDLYLKKHYKEALHLYHQFLIEDPQNPEADWVQYTVAMCYAGMKDYKKSIEELRKVVERYPASKYADNALERMAMYYWTCLEQPQKAIEVYKEILEKYPEADTAPYAQYYFGIIYAQLENYPRARQELTNLIRLYPESQLIERAREQLLEISKKEATEKRLKKKRRNEK